MKCFRRNRPNTLSARSITIVSHLILQRKNLSPGTEWEFQPLGWGFLRVRQGEGYLMETPTPRLLNEADVLTQAPPARSVIRASRLGDLHLDYFYLLPELLLGVVSLGELQRLREQHPLQPARVFSAQEPLALQFSALISNHEKGEQLSVRCLMLNLASFILRDLLPQRATPEPRWALTAQERFQTLVREMPIAELQQSNAEELARRCGCSARHFCRLFKEHFGCSLLSMQISFRVQRAQQLLLETDAKIIEVAMESGFQHVGLFTSTFKRHAKLTPSQWRKRARSAHLKQTAAAKSRRAVN